MAFTLPMPTTTTFAGPHPTVASRWSLRIALLSAAVILASALSHRLLGMSTPVALNLFKVGFAGAAAAVLLALVALYMIWRFDARGVLAITGTAVIVTAIFAWPLAYLAQFRSLPQLTDVSTDVRSPPLFEALRAVRVAPANPSGYPGSTVAQQQAEAYPDIRTVPVNRSVEETFELAYRVASRVFKMQIVAEAPPNAKPGQPGRIEAVDRTLILGFYDDVSIRIAGDQLRSRIDIRSSSRYGQHDLGRNASRVRKFLREMQAQLDVTVPTSSGERIARLRDRLGKRIALPKRGQAAGQDAVDPRSSLGRGTSDAPRAPGQKVKQRVPGEGQSRDTRPPQPPR